MIEAPTKPIVLITGASGNLGRSMAGVLARDYQPVTTLRLPKPLAAAGAWAQAKPERVIPTWWTGARSPSSSPSW